MIARYARRSTSRSCGEAGTGTANATRARCHDIQVDVTSLPRKAQLDSPSLDLDVGSLYRRYYPMVARRVRQFVAASEVEEVAHDVFVRVMERAHQFRAESSPVTWLYRMTTNHCLNRVRDNKTRKSLIEQFGPTAWPSAHREDPELRLFVHDAWRELDPELADIGVYFYLDGMTQAEIGKLLGYSERTITNRLSALEDALRKREQRR